MIIPDFKYLYSEIDIFKIPIPLDLCTQVDKSKDILRKNDFYEF